MSQEEDRSTGHIDSDRGDLSFDSITWSESPGMVFGPRSVASKSLAEPEPHTYQPDPRDLVGVERWVSRPFGLRPGVPPGISTQTEGIYPSIALPGQNRPVWGSDLEV